MNISEALTYELQSINGLSKKVFPSVAPEGIESPYLVYELTDIMRYMTQTQFDGLIETNLTIAVYEKTNNLVMALIEAVIAKIKSFLFRNIGVNGLYCQNVKIENQLTTFDFMSRKYQAQIDIKISYKEA